MNLLAEGPNTLKVGDKVRLRFGTAGTITTVTSEADWLDVAQPIGGCYSCSTTQQEISRRWYANGHWLDVSDDSENDIIGVIRPGRTELITEENERELHLARKKRGDYAPNILPTLHDYGW